MANFKFHKYRYRSNVINLTNYIVFTSITILVLISAHAKSAHLNDNNNNNDNNISSTVTPTSTKIINATEPVKLPTQQAVENVESASDHEEEKVQLHRSKHHQQQHHQHTHQVLDASVEHKKKHHSHRHSHNVMLNPHTTTNARRPYRSKFTIEELLHNKFEHLVSDDIDMDPCKAGGFMGDIALPDISNDDPIVAFTPAWQPQADAPLMQQDKRKNINATFQQELEILKQEVYHEGLQVEEEGLTDIIRKKTKLPNSNSEYYNERSRNDPIISANELIKPTDFSSNSDYLTKNLKTGIISQRPQNHLLQSKENSFPTETDYFQPKISIREKPISVVVDEGLAHKRPTISHITQIQRTKVGLDAAGTNKFEIIAAASSTAPANDAQKLNKSTAGFVSRNVDHRKIQSDTKDIEDDSGNNFVSARKSIILPTSLPTQRSTLPNVYSNAGGNGMKLDDVEFLHAEGMVRRRHRRGRKNRRSSEKQRSSDYSLKLQHLRNELNRPVRTVDDMIALRNRYSSARKIANGKPFNSYHNFNTTIKFEMPNLKRDHDHRMKLKTAAKNLNYSSERSDELEMVTKRKYTMDAMNAEVHHSSLEMDLQNEENFKHLEHHHRMARAVTAKKERVWDYGVIPFEIDGNFSGLHKALFKQAMRHWENFTCIKFVERDPEVHPNYIVFTVRGCGCCSFVGKRGNGPQAISIGRNCDKFGIVVHELGHVVGFWHEHTRPDREKHVVIELNNIMKGQDYNFNKLTPEEVDSLGMAYDYDSIMHYARNTFSKGTYLDTILPIEVKGKKRPEIGQRLRLSAGDIAQANLLYRCPRCGRTFQDSTGAFGSPTYYTVGAQSNETERCEWRITATHGERIVLRLENLNLLHTDNCQTDFLEIRDGYYYKSPLIGRLCGKATAEVITTESSRMLLTYVNSHRAEGYRGFKAEFETICGGELSVDDSEGRLESPNYPLDYLANKECIWKITVPKGYQVALKFQSFEVENHDSCVYDFVEVHDGPTQESPLVGVFCGYKPPPHMKSTGNTMFVKFVSDTSVQKAGFSAVFMKEVDECETQNHGCEQDCINTLGGYECSCHIGYELHSDKKHCEDACGGVIEYPNGTITSPSFPDKYPLLKECIWEIIAPPKHKISFNFTHFDLEGTAHQQSDCGYDAVTIYSKLSENRLKRIGTYCGSVIPPTATSEGNALRIEFHSDKSIQRSGFAAVFFTDIDECSVNNGGCQHECRNTIGSYVCSCHNGYSLHDNGHDCKEGECKHAISAPFGTIYSPNYPDKYPPNMDCVWHFSTTPGHRIKLIFNEFNVEPHQECAYDNVAIYDGDSESKSILGRFCGDKIPYPISSSTNQLYMVLKTDRNKERMGFTAVHSTSCGGYLRATNHIQQFYSHSRFGNSNYDENMDCEWTIQAPPSSNVQLLFLTFDIESSDNCTYDYVQVFSGMEDTSGPMYGQYCGNSLPQDIISMTDSLLVRFKTDSSVNMKGYSASYVAVDPFENSDEDANEYSSEMVTPFPGSLKSIYKKDDSQESDDYSDFSENQLIIRSPYRSRGRYPNRL